MKRTTSVDANAPPLCGVRFFCKTINILNNNSAGLPGEPNNRAVFNFAVRRGTLPLPGVSTPAGYTETSATTAAPYNLDGSTGLYEDDIVVTELVDECFNGAAFAAELRVWGKATDGRNGRNGRQRRLRNYRRRLIAFALAEAEDGEQPQEP